MFAQHRVVLKTRGFITALPLYYSGHLLKKNKKEKHFKRYHAELRGATLFLYKDERQDTYVEKLDLEEMMSMELSSSDEQKEKSVIFTLRLYTDDVQLKLDNYNTVEEWKCYIQTVITKKIPSELHLLPGQVLQLQEVLNQEKKRNLSKFHPPLPPRPSFLLMPTAEVGGSVNHGLPTCFFHMTREEAEQILEDNPEYGSIILRPSTLANNYALTLRQLTPSGPVMKHYRISFTNSGYVIELKKPVTVSTLNEVVNYFMEMTEYRLYPYLSTQAYNTQIEHSTESNGFNTPTSPTAAIQRKAPVAPMRGLHPEDLTPPSPTKPVDHENIPDVPSPKDEEANGVLMHSELLERLRQRSTILGSAVDEVVDNTYENQGP